MKSSSDKSSVQKQHLNTNFSSSQSLPPSQSNSSLSFYFESLGAPCLLYRHLPSYAPADSLQPPRIAPYLTSTSSKSLQSTRTKVATAFSCPPIDVTNNFHPPQPWGRSPLDRDSYFQESNDANFIQKLLTGADRARIRSYFKPSLGFQKWNRAWWEREMRKNHGSSHIKEKKRKRCKQSQQSNHMSDQRADLISDNESSNESERLTDCSSEPDFNMHPDLSNTRKWNRQKFDRFPYVASNSSRQLLLAESARVAMNFRIERMHSSPKDGYCTPFTSAIVRFGVNRNKKLLSSRNNPLYRRTSNFHIHEKRFNDEMKKNAKKAMAGDLSDVYPSDCLGNLHEDDSKDGSVKDQDNDIGRSSQESTESTNDSSSIYSDSDTSDGFNGVKSLSLPASKQRRASVPTKTRWKTLPKLECITQSPKYYGNCLSVIPCPCDCKETSNRCNSWFLFYALGHCVIVARIMLPNTGMRFTNDGKHSHSSSVVDIGGKVLQLSQFFNVDGENYLYRDSKLFCFAARSPTQICILTWEARGCHHSDVCSVSFHLRHKTAIDLKSNANKQIYTPLYLTTRRDDPQPVLGHAMVFATVSSIGVGSPYREIDTSFIHFCSTKQEGEAAVQLHNIKGINAISQIEFSGVHPLVLLSAARSSASYPYFGGIRNRRRPVIGYGHALYTIDLRSDQAVFTWSPSRAEFFQERIHSVSGIYPDPSNPHYIYITSLSAGGKMWKLDHRMPSRSLYSWALPGLGDDHKPIGVSSGVYGEGVIITKPIIGSCSSIENIMQPVFSVSKNPGSYGFHSFHDPPTRPRFATHALEKPACPDGGGDFTSFATSSSFKLADSSEGVYTTGLAAFYTPITSMLKESSVDALGYGSLAPTHCLCVITATSYGDLYGYTLLKNYNNVAKRSILFDGLPLGSSAVPIPEDVLSKHEENDNQDSLLAWKLANKFPIPGDCLSKEFTSNKTQVRPFQTIERRFMNHSSSHYKKPPVEHVSVHKPCVDWVYIGDESHTPTRTLDMAAEWYNLCEDMIVKNSDQRRFSVNQEKSKAVNNPNVSRSDLKDENIDRLCRLWDSNAKSSLGI